MLRQLAHKKFTVLRVSGRDERPRDLIPARGAAPIDRPIVATVTFGNDNTEKVSAKRTVAGEIDGHV
jgi:hypothetical protein